MVLRRRQLLGLGALGLAGTAFAGCRSGRPNLVVVAARGGWDTTFAVDPKSDPAVEGPEVYTTGRRDDVDAVESFSGIPVKVNPVRRPALSEFFEEFGDRAVVVNGIDVGSIAHVECLRRMWTGGDGSVASDAPDIATLGGAPAHPTRPVGCLDLGPGVMPGSLGASVVRVGRNGQLADLLSPTVGFRDDVDAIARWRTHRARAGSLHPGGLPASDAEAADRAAQLPNALDGIALDAGDPVRLAVAALRTKACGSVYLDPGLAWDTHQGNAPQDPCWNDLFGLLRDLARSLEDGGSLDDTLVLVLSEMGRPPTRNSIGGKDHWPVTSALLFGGGIAGGRVIGGTDEALGPLEVGGATLSPARLLAGVLDHLGVAPDDWFPGVERVELT